MPKYSELELRYARPVAQEILESSAFREWLFAGTKHQDSALGARPIGEIQERLRSRTMKNPYWFNYWCGKGSKCVCKIGEGIETDILLIFDCVSGRRLGLHIEIKRPGQQLEHGQAKSYPARATCWVTPAKTPRTVPYHQDFLTMLICGRNLEYGDHLQYFDKVVFHDEIEQKIRPYPEAS